METSVIYEIVEEQIAIVTIQRPKALNALNQEVMLGIEKNISELIENEKVRGIIITGSGNKSFVAGADITEITELQYEEAVSFSLRGQKIFQLIENSPKPIIAAINGYALGGGCELAMACHLRIASENAIFGQPEIKLGIIPGYGGTQRLIRLIGKTKATEFLLNGENINADQALQLGLINKVCLQGELIESAKEMMKKILKFSSIAIANTLECIQAYDNPAFNGFEVEAINFAKCIASEDGKEGTKAFLEKRAPAFKSK